MRICSPRIQQFADTRVKMAVVVHACDTVSALSTVVTGALPRRGAATATAVSALNVVLAVVASRHES